MQKKGIILSILGAVLLTVLIVLALLPGIVSSDLMKPLVLQTINQQIAGQLQVNQWSLSWFGKMEIKGIVFDNREDLLARIAEFKTSRGILGLLWGRGNLGEVDIIEPALFFYISEKTRPPQPKDSRTPGRSPESPSHPGKKTAAGHQFAVADLQKIRLH